MAYGETKVYFDGSHYIAIPHSEQPKRYRPKMRAEEEIIVADSETEPLIPCINDEMAKTGEVVTGKDCAAEIVKKLPKTERKNTRKELFEELYKKYISLKKGERKRRITEEMRPYFDTDEQLKTYVEIGFERKRRNLICRRVRMVRKAYLARFNYFCTFTYDGKLHTEESFKKGLQTCFRNLCYRKGWKYMGVWERSPQMQRLHFHGLFAIPENTLQDDLEPIRDYSTKNKRMQISHSSKYFTERFGRNDFKELDPRLLGESIRYLMKYIEKTGERIVYSKGLYQYFISDIMDEDIICPYGEEEKKFVLADNFNCWDEGVLMGRVSPEVIAQMRKSN